MKESWLIIKLENVAIAMHCNLRPPDAAPVLIRFNYDVHAKFKVAEPIHCVFGTDTLLYTVTLSFDFWPWTFAVYRLWRDETLYRMWTQSINLRRSYWDFNIRPNNPERRDLRQVIRVWIIAFLCWYVMSRCDHGLWPLDLKLLRHFDCHMFKLCTKFGWNRISHGWVLLSQVGLAEQSD